MSNDSVSNLMKGHIESLAAEGKRADGHLGMKCSTVVSVGNDIVCDSYQFQLKPPSAMGITVGDFLIKFIFGFFILF